MTTLPPRPPLQPSLATPSGPGAAVVPVRIMLVDDSAVVRSVISRTLETDPSLQVVASVSNGQLALDSLKRADPDIVILDVEMPVMDGLTALPKLLEARPGLKVLMCSTLTVRNGDVAMKALSLGAADCIAKPTSTHEIGSQDVFRTNLLYMVRTLGRSVFRIRRESAVPQRPVSPAPATVTAARSVTTSSAPSPSPGQKFSLRPLSRAFTGKPELIAIGSSTGGPQALFEVLTGLKGLRQPIIITQHMPPTFTAILAQHISQKTGITAVEGADGMRLEGGKIYVAPGGRHMELDGQPGNVVIRLTDGPAENYCKPSVEPMMRSAVRIYGNKVLGTILTGMGQDGLESCRLLAESGGRLIAQDEETSVVWGMPGAVAMAGICNMVLPLDKIGPWIREAAM